MIFNIFGYSINIKIEIGKIGALPTNRWQARLLAAKVDRLALEMYRSKSKIARIKALREIYRIPGGMDIPLCSHGLKECKDWVEYAFENNGLGDMR